MNKRRLRLFAMLLLSTSMVAVGYLGLAGKVQKSPVLIAILLATLVGISFSLGRQSVRLGNT